jgi:RNA polymerase-associated protein
VNTTLAAWGKRKVANAVRSRSVLTLFSGRADLDSHRARLVVAAKGVVCDQILCDPSNLPEDLIDLNPYRSLPTLVDRDLVLYDVNVIGEYLDERYPHPPLMPIDPQARARVRLGLARVNEDWLAPARVIVGSERAAADAARKALRDLLIAGVPVFKASKFFLNPDFTLVDCAVAPLIWRLPHLGINLPRDAQAIADYGERIFKSPGFRRSLTDIESQWRN